jgi:hypothetical protein
MATLMETLLQQMDGETVSQVAQQLGVDEQTARKGIGLGVPTLVAALADDVATEEQAANFVQNLQLSPSTGDLGTILGSLLGGQTGGQAAPAGGAGDLAGMLGSLLGGQTGGQPGGQAAPAAGGELGSLLGSLLGGQTGGQAAPAPGGLGGILGTLLGGSQSGAADAILTQILGEKQTKVEDNLSRSTGIDGHALLKVLAPIVIAGVVRWMSSQKSGAVAQPSDLASALKTEKEAMQTQGGDLMQVVTGMLDSNNDGSIVDDAMNIFNKLLSSRG